MNVYGDAATVVMLEAHGKIVGLALNGTEAVLSDGKNGERGRNRTFNLLMER
jgi:hypothetical protein